MKSDARMLVLVLGAAACGGRAKPPARPTPAATSQASAPPSVSRDTALVPSDSISRVAFVIPDSVLTKQVAAVFGDWIIPDPPEPVPEGPTWDMDVRSYETHRRVEFYVNAFTGSARERFISRLEKGSRYEPMIREKLRAGK